jgi:predicted nuclease of predicted toxin-antitoxin system
VKVLFDHNLPHKLRTGLDALGKHEIVTASYMGWGDLKNGELLRIAEQSGIEVLVTGDQSPLHEQNLTGRGLAVVALSTNNWPIVKNYLPQILKAINCAVAGSFQALEPRSSPSVWRPALYRPIEVLASSCAQYRQPSRTVGIEGAHYGQICPPRPRTRNAQDFSPRIFGDPQVLVHRGSEGFFSRDKHVCKCT